MGVFHTARLLANSKWQPAQRVLRVLGVAACAALLCSIAVADLVTDKLLRVDFKSFYLGAQIAADGSDFYSPSELRRAGESLGMRAPFFPYIYPPPLAHWLKPLAQLPPLEAQLRWFMLSIGAIGVAWAAMLETFVPDSGASARAPARSLQVRTFAVLAAVLLLWLMPLRHNFAMGQVNALVLALLCSALLALRVRAEVVCGALLALAIAIKTTPALFLLYLAARRKFAAAFATAATLGLLWAVSLFDGAGADWRRWVELLPSMGHGEHIPGLYDPAVVCNFSPAGLFARTLGDGTWVRGLALTSTAVITAVAGYAAFSAKSRAQLQLSLALFFLAMVLISPLTYVHHVLYIAPAMLIWACHIFGLGRPAYLLLLAFLAALSSADFPPWVERLTENVPWRFVTSLNLYGLLGLFAFGTWLRFSRVLERSARSDSELTVQAYHAESHGGASAQAAGVVNATS